MQRKRTLETVSTPRKKHQQTVISSADGTKVLNGVENDNKNGDKILDSSKNVDENGEPLVVYHGSEEGFNIRQNKRVLNVVCLHI
jgi:hypothetical protein